MVEPYKGSINPPPDQDWVWDNGTLKWGDWVWDTSTQLWKDPATSKFYDTSGNLMPDVGPDANKPITARWDWDEVNKSIKPPADQNWVWDNGVLKWGDKTWDEQRQLWKDGAGKYYDTDGNPVSNVGDTPPGAKWTWKDQPSDPGTGNPWKPGPWNPIGLPDKPPGTGGGGGGSGGNPMPGMPTTGIRPVPPHLAVTGRQDGTPVGQPEAFKPWGQPLGYLSQALRYGGKPQLEKKGGFNEWDQPGIRWEDGALKWSDKVWDPVNGGWLDSASTQQAGGALATALRGEG